MQVTINLSSENDSTGRDETCGEVNDFTEHDEIFNSFVNIMWHLICSK